MASKPRAIYQPAGAALEYAPLALNLYDRCAHGCRYCYVPRCLHTTAEQFHQPARLRPGILEALERDCQRLQQANLTAPELAEQVGERHHKRVLLCFTSDPYQPGDNDATRRALEILARYGVPATVLTKGGMRAARDFGLMAEMGCWFGTTLITLDERKRQEWEPRAASVYSRLQAIDEALYHFSRGDLRQLYTWLSIEPIIWPQDAIEVVEYVSSRGLVSEVRLGKLNHHPAAAEVDWREWAPRLLKACRDSGRSYLIKESLRPYLPEGAEVRREVPHA